MPQSIGTFDSTSGTSPGGTLYVKNLLKYYRLDAVGRPSGDRQPIVSLFPFPASCFYIAPLAVHFFTNWHRN